MAHFLRNRLLTLYVLTSIKQNPELNTGTPCGPTCDDLKGKECSNKINTSVVATYSQRKWISNQVASWNKSLNATWSRICTPVEFSDDKQYILHFCAKRNTCFRKLIVCSVIDSCPKRNEHFKCYQNINKMVSNLKGKNGYLYVLIIITARKRLSHGREHDHGLWRLLKAVDSPCTTFFVLSFSYCLFWTTLLYCVCHQ